MRPRSPSSLPATATAYAVQVALAALVFVTPGASGLTGFWKYGVGILLLPLVVRVLCHRPMTPLQRVWTSSALGLHALGAVYGFYALWWYDHLTHAVSAGLVVACVYAVAIPLARVLPRRVPTRTLHAVAFGCLVAAGVTWEVYELYVPHLVVYGAEDTAKDLVFDVVGWAVVAPVHRRLLAHVPKGLTARAVAYTGRTRPLPG
jgi:hypothetical protein